MLPLPHQTGGIVLRTFRVRSGGLATVVALFFGLAACAPQQKPFELHLSQGGKADGTSLLSPEDRARIDDAFVAAIKSGEAEVKRLEDEIARLEGEISRKQSEIDSLVSQIEARKREIEQNYNLQLAAAVGLGLLTFGLGSVIAGAGAVASLAAALNSDSRLNDLNRKLSDARTTQQQVRDQRAAYATKKTTIMAQVDKVRAAKQRLLAELDQPAAVVVPGKLSTYAQAGAPYRRWKTMEAIVASVRSEIASLTELRDAAKELLASIDAALATVKQLADDADKLAQQTRDEFLYILEAALSGDPLAVATKWLSNALAKKTQEMLTELGFPAADFVAHLVKMRFTGSDADLAALRDQLVAKLTSEIVDAGTGEEPGTPPPPSEPPPSSATGWHYETTSTTPVPIPDLQLVSSTLSVPQAGHVTRGTIEVSINHTYVGDLVLMLAHGDTIQVLVKQTDDLEQSLHETWALSDLVGADASGDWELLVSDEGKGDSGTLVSWKLSLDGTP